MYRKINRSRAGISEAIIFVYVTFSYSSIPVFSPVMWSGMMMLKVSGRGAVFYKGQLSSREQR